MLEMLFRSRFRWRLRPHSVTGDAAYGTKENVAALEKAGIRAYTALPDHEKRTHLLGRDAFVYDAEKDVYTCPRASSCAARATTIGRGPSGTPRAPPPATPVPSRRDARRARTGAG
jgi:hypothetical protein